MSIKLVNGRRMFAIDIDSRPDGWYYNIHIWCKENCIGKWTTTSEFVAFDKEEDAMFFTLTRK